MFKEVLDHSRSLPWKIGNKVIPCSTPARDGNRERDSGQFL